MDQRKHTTRYPGVRYRDKQTESPDGKADRCFFIRYKRNRKVIEEAAGWASHGMNALKAHSIRAELLQNIREGKAPQTLKEKRQAEEQRQEAAALVVEQKKRDEYTFDQAAQAFFEWGRENKKSWRDDKSRYDNHVKDVICHLPMKDVSPLHLERIRSNMKKAVPYKNRRKTKTASSVNPGLSNKTIHLTLTLIRAIYRKHIAWGLYDGPVPTEKIKFPSLDNSRTRFLSYEEARLLLESLKKKSLAVYSQALLGLHCGLRFSEIANLRWYDVDLKHKIIYIRDAKGGKSRQAYITPAVEEIFILLDSIHGYKKDNLIFPDRSATKKNQVHVSSTFYRTIAELGFNEDINDRRQRVCFHTLRHTFGSWLAIQGTSLYEIKELMGHSTIQMTERYSHLLPSVKRDAVHRMAATFGEIMEAKENETTGGDEKTVDLNAQK